MTTPTPAHLSISMSFIESPITIVFSAVNPSRSHRRCSIVALLTPLGPMSSHATSPAPKTTECRPRSAAMCPSPMLRCSSERTTRRTTGSARRCSNGTTRTDIPSALVRRSWLVWNTPCTSSTAYVALGNSGAICSRRAAGSNVTVSTISSGVTLVSIAPLLHTAQSSMPAAWHTGCVVEMERPVAATTMMPAS